MNLLVFLKVLFKPSILDSFWLICGSDEQSNIFKKFEQLNSSDHILKPGYIGLPNNQYFHT